MVMESFSLNFFIRLLSTVAVWLSAVGLAYSQGCNDADSNVLCAGSPSQSATEENSPVSFGCLNVQQSTFYTFHTNGVASSNSVSISITNADCSDFLGADSIYIMVIQLVNDSDPCNNSNYSNPVCYGDDAVDFNFQLNTLLNDQDYMVVIGSNHDTTYGSCAYGVSIDGDALSLVAGVNPLRVNLGDPAQLTVEGQNPGSDITWSPAETLSDSSITNPVAIPEETTTYTVTGYVGDCQVTDMVTVTVAPPLEIYNTFTPNSDGINDTWKIGRIEKFPNCQVQVYDRWGQLVFKSIGYAQPWDGTNKGKRLPMAAYYYVIELNSLDVKTVPITGTISIMH